MTNNRRRYTRVVAQNPLVLAGEGLVAEGRLVDLSYGGCAIESKGRAFPGLYLEARILLYDDALPLKVELAPVRWASHGRFGIEFIRVPEADLTRLSQYLHGLTGEQAVVTHAEQATPTTTNAEKANPLILIADDDDQIRTLLRAILQEAGYRIIEASDGKQIVNYCAEHAVDLVLTDIVMPEKDGLEVLMHFRSQVRPPKFIAMTGAPCEMDALEAAVHLGAHAVLTKPIDIPSLLDNLRTLLPTLPAPQVVKNVSSSERDHHL